MQEIQQRFWHGAMHLLPFRLCPVPKHADVVHGIIADDEGVFKRHRNKRAAAGSVCLGEQASANCGGAGRNQG